MMGTHKLRINGKEVSREEFFRNAPAGGPGIPMTASTYREDAPLCSTALSVHPDQCEMMNEAVRKHGISGVHYDASKKRNCVITSREGRRKWMRVFGQMTGHGAIHDNDGGYGDG